MGEYFPATPFQFPFDGASIQQVMCWADVLDSFEYGFKVWREDKGRWQTVTPMRWSHAYLDGLRVAIIDPKPQLYTGIAGEE